MSFDKITPYIHAMVEKDLFTKKSRLQVEAMTAGTRWFKYRLIAFGITAVTIALIITALVFFPSLPQGLVLALISIAGLCMSASCWALCGAAPTCFGRPTNSMLRETGCSRF